MKIFRLILFVIGFIFLSMPLPFSSINHAYASREEILDLEEEKSDIEDKIEERRARGKSYDDLEERRNDVQDEIDNVREEG